jgi:hypothetical protein
MAAEDRKDLRTEPEAFRRNQTGFLNAGYSVMRSIEKVTDPKWSRAWRKRQPEYDALLRRLQEQRGRETYDPITGAEIYRSSSSASSSRASKRSDDPRSNPVVQSLREEPRRPGFPIAG